MIGKHALNRVVGELISILLITFPFEWQRTTRSNFEENFSNKDERRADFLASGLSS